MGQRGKYFLLWRWHMIAGMVLSPVLLISAFTGGIYVFAPQIESWLHPDLIIVKPEEKKLSIPEQLQSIYDEDDLISFIPGKSRDRSSQVIMANLNGVETTYFVNPYSGKLLGSISGERLMQKVRRFHKDLFSGNVGRTIVEFGASWVIVLFILGTMLWWPKDNMTFRNALKFQWNKGRRTFRGIHTVGGIFFGFLVLTLVITSIPWTKHAGENVVSRIEASLGGGFPIEAFVPPNSQVVDSTHSTINLLQVQAIANQLSLNGPFLINFPNSPEDVYSLISIDDRPESTFYVHIDQYTGAVLHSTYWDQLKPLTKAITIGVRLHEGRLFGLTNQLLMALGCLVLIGLIATGWIMWWKRKPEGRMGLPSVKKLELPITLWIVLLLLGVLLPVFGISFLLLIAIEWLNLKRSKSQILT